MKSVISWSLAARLYGTETGTYIWQRTWRTGEIWLLCRGSWFSISCFPLSAHLSCFADLFTCSLAGCLLVDSLLLGLVGFWALMAFLYNFWIFLVKPLAVRSFFLTWEDLRSGSQHTERPFIQVEKLESALAYECLPRCRRKIFNRPATDWNFNCGSL